MPCYLFTFHAYLSWLPDRKRGYVKRKRGILPCDPEMARRYREAAKEDPVWFDEEIQRLLINEALVASQFQKTRVHVVATDPSHVHELLSWRDRRSWETLRESAKSSLTRRLNKELGKRRWFIEGGSRKRVRDRDHFEYLINVYLPDHIGLKWKEEIASNYSNDSNHP
jgi:REP element-mobilizing transposase RayT